MQYLGRTGDWAAYQHEDRTVFVNVNTLDATDPIEPSLVAAGAETFVVHEEGLEVENSARQSFIGPSLFSEEFGENTMIRVPSGVRAAAKRAIEWRRVYERGGTDVGLATARLLASHDKISLKKVRHIAKYFPRHTVDKKATGWKSGQEGFPTAGRIAWDLWGGDAAERWASSQVSKADRRVLSGITAAAAAADLVNDSDLVEDDAAGSVPHAFHPSIQQPYACTYCLNSPTNPIHDDAAVNYALESINPDWAHLFSESPTDEEVCDVCGQDASAWQHQHANAAVRITNPGDFEYQKSLTQDVPEEAPIAASAYVLNMDAISRAQASIESALHPDFDHYITVAPNDPMIATGLYKQVGETWYEWSALATRWLKSSPAGPVYLVDVDAETAQFVLNGLQDFGTPVDLRLLDPEEYALHQESMSGLDWDFIDTLLETAPEFGIIAAAGDGEYTPEERAENAKRQVRDANGRFARSNDSVYLPDGTPGKISKINPDTKEVTVVSDIDGTETTISAKEIEIQNNQPPSKLDLDAIRAIPRATRITPKAFIDNLLPPMDAGAIAQVIKDYSAYIAKERNLNIEAFALKVVDVDGVPVYKTLEGSEIPPIYLALVDEDDNSAILDMIAIIPASEEGAEVRTVRRTNLGWEIDNEIRDELLSSVPPAVVALKDDQIADTEAQIVEWYSANGSDVSPEAAEASLYDRYGTLIAAGGADRNRGNAEELRRYWLTGKGAAKIRWNTPGDWKRCYKHLAKYMGPRAKGYCSLRHKEATGVWPGDKTNVGKKMRTASNAGNMFFTPGDLFDLRPVDKVLSLVASGVGVYDDEMLPEIPQEVALESTGLPFVIPVVAPVNIESGDGRLIHPMALSFRDLPLPLMWQIKTGAGHDGAVVVGRIDSIDVLENGGLGNARGVFDTNPYAREAERMVDNGFLNGVSVDLDKFRAVSKANADEASVEGETRISNDKTEIEEGRVMGITIVPKPAFQECHIYIDRTATDGEVPIVADGTYAGVPSNEEDVEALVAAALLAAGIPVNPPSAWFRNPHLKEPTPLTVDPDGRVFGHIATWTTDHIGIPMSTKPPRSRSNYSYFHTGTLHTDDGDLVPVGQITLAGGHAPLNLDAASAAAHYDNTHSAWCDVHAGEDEFGIWVSGALRPSVTPENIRAIRASAPSGDWRPIGGRLEMVAVCSVNVPGFPVTRALVSSGELVALVAAGTSVLLEARKSAEGSTYSELAARLERLEAPQRARLDALRTASINRKAESAKTRFAALLAENTRAEKIATETRDGEASVKIETLADLRIAIQTYGSSPDKPAAKAYIIQRAREMNATDSLPGVWQRVALTASAQEVKDRFAALGVKTLDERLSDARAAFASKKRDFDPKRHPRADDGKFRAVLARLRTDLEELKMKEDPGNPQYDEGTASGSADSKIADLAEVEGELTGGDIDAAKIAGARLLHELDLTDTEIGDARLAERLRDDYSLLGDVVYNIGVPVGEDDLLRWSELPPVLQDLVDGLVTRIEEQTPDDESNETAQAVEDLKGYMGGDDQLKQGEISALLSKLVRLLV